MEREIHSLDGWRRLRRMSQAKLAESVGVTTNTIRLWERNPEMIPLGKAKKILVALDIDFNQIDFFCP